MESDLGTYSSSSMAPAFGAKDTFDFNTLFDQISDGRFPSLAKSQCEIVLDGLNIHGCSHAIKSLIRRVPENWNCSRQAKALMIGRQGRLDEAVRLMDKIEPASANANTLIYLLGAQKVLTPRLKELLSLDASEPGMATAPGSIFVWSNYGIGNGAIIRRCEEAESLPHGAYLELLTHYSKLNKSGEIRKWVDRGLMEYPKSNLLRYWHLSTLGGPYQVSDERCREILHEARYSLIHSLSIARRSRHPYVFGFRVRQVVSQHVGRLWKVLDKIEIEA